MRLPRRRKVPDRCKVLARNLGMAHGRPQPGAVADLLIAEILRHDPDGLVLTEAAPYHGVLDLPGWRQYQEAPGRRGDRTDDSGDVAILIREDHKVRRRWVAHMTRWWTVLSHRQRHEPHAYENVVAEIRGRVWRVRGSHPPTHGFDGPNGEAFTETARRSRRWFRRGLPGVPSVDVGDWNETKERLQAWFGDRFKVFGKRIDVAVTRNVEGCEVEELPKRGFDHYGRVYTLTAR